MQNHNIVGIEGLAVRNHLKAGVGHSLVDRVVVGDRVVDNGVGRQLLRVHPALEIGGAGADAPRLHKNGERVIKTIIGPANGVIDGNPVVIDPQPGIFRVPVQCIHCVQTQLSHAFVVVQTGGGSDLEVVRVAHIAVFCDAVESKFMEINGNLGHKVAVGGMEIGQLRGLQSHVVPVHVKALVCGPGEQVGPVRIDAGDDHYVDVVQHGVAIASAQIGDHDQRGLAGGGLVGVDLGLNPHSELAVVRHQLAGLLQRGCGGEVGVGKDCYGHFILVGGGCAQVIEIHVRLGGVLCLQIVQHLFLGGELVIGAFFCKEGGIILLIVGQSICGKVVQNFIRPEGQNGVCGPLGVIVGDVGQVRRGGFIAGIRHFPRLHRQLHTSGGQILLCHVENLAHVVVAVAPDPIAVGAGLAEDEAAVRILGYLGQGGHCILAAGGGIALVHRDGDFRRVHILWILKFQRGRGLCGQGGSDQQTAQHGSRQQQAGPFTGAVHVHVNTPFNTGWLRLVQRNDSQDSFS